MPKTLGDIRHKELVRILIQKRRDAGLRQVELAQQMKVYQSLIARLESGERRVDVVELIRLGEVLGFDPAQVVANLAQLRER
ncbi:MAG: helix-turn-helix transcriptional regulator [Pseudomonadota bacterium]